MEDGEWCRGLFCGGKVCGAGPAEPSVIPSSKGKFTDGGAPAPWEPQDPWVSFFDFFAAFFSFWVLVGFFFDSFLVSALLAMMSLLSSGSASGARFEGSIPPVGARKVFLFR
jgi:hypothetical protein